MACEPTKLARPFLVFDGECSFCTRIINRLQVVTGDRITYEPFQTAANRFPHIPLAEFQKAVMALQPKSLDIKAYEVAKEVALN